MYIVTNTTGLGEYTPSRFKKLENAKKWLIECTAENIRSWKEDEHDELLFMRNNKVIEWAKNNLGRNFEFSEEHSLIVYGDGSYNLMNIYEV